MPASVFFAWLKSTLNLSTSCPALHAGYRQSPFGLEPCSPRPIDVAWTPPGQLPRVGEVVAPEAGALPKNPAHSTHPLRI
jgi:hypothetical protein